MITSISNNFGANPITLKCHDSAKIVVLQGSLVIDTTNADYQAAEQLEITFPNQFSIRNSKPTTAFLVCQKDDYKSGTIVKAQIQLRKLIIEKLPIYDGQGIVTLILASGFVGEACEALLAPASSAKITMSGKDYTVTTSIGQYANCIKERWGMFYLLMSSWSYMPGVENEYNITGLPSDLCIDVPVFVNGSNYTIPGSDCALAHIENGKITFTGKGQAGQTKKYLSRAFMKFFFVRGENDIAEY